MKNGEKTAKVAVFFRMVVAVEGGIDSVPE